MSEPDVEIYAATWCPYCIRAVDLLEKKGVRFRYVDVDVVPEARQEMQRRGGGHTIPQIFIGGKHIGGSDDILELERRGQLDELLQRA